MSVERNNGVRELGNPRRCMRSFRVINNIHQVRVPEATTWVLMGNESEQQGGSNASITSFIPFLFLIGAVIGLLQVKDLFETHPANMWTSVAALPIFCFSHAAKKKIINGVHQLIDALRVLSAALVVASLLSVLLPDRLCYLPFLLWLLLAASILAYPGLIKAFHSVIYISKRLGQRTTTVEPDALPV